MHNNYIKNRDAVRIIENNRNGIISVCCNNEPVGFPICYDTDTFCGCLRIYFYVKKCSDLAYILEENNKLSLIVTTSNNNNFFGFNNCSNGYNVIATGKAKFIDEEDECCKKKEKCEKLVEMKVDKIIGRINENC